MTMDISPELIEKAKAIFEGKFGTLVISFSIEGLEEAAGVGKVDIPIGEDSPDELLKMQGQKAIAEATIGFYTNLMDLVAAGEKADEK